MNFIEMDNKLNRYLRLSTFPVAVRMLESEQELTGDGGLKKSSGMPMPVCQGISLSRRYGWRVVQGREDMSCPLGAVALGFVPPKPKFLDGTIEVPYWVRTREARAKIARNLPKLEWGKYKFLISAPLNTADFEPHLVIVYGNPAQAMRLVQSCIYLTGDPVVSSSYGAAGCGTYISKTLLTDECQFVLSGAGDRIFAATQDHEVCFSIPMGRMEAILRGLEETYRAGMRYPTPSYLKSQIELPDTYKDLLGYLQVEQIPQNSGELAALPPSG
ncbi:MAG: DUF169 domain-containing protein [Deltaproteobacteria bacterium]|nr:DUF169 domain-containing protein [Deltaproteobacteria bacterium]